MTRTSRGRTVVTATLLSLLLLWCSLASPGEAAAAALGNGPPAENYDIRDDDSKEAHTALERHRQKLTPGRRAELANLRREILRAKGRLALRVPNLEVTFSKHTGAPEIVGARGTERFLTFSSGNSTEKVTRDFLTENGSLYGLSASQIARLEKTADYANPAGNFLWVSLEQRISGIPVFTGELKAALTKRRELARTIGQLVPGIVERELETRPATGAADAVSIAARSVGVSVVGSQLGVKGASPDGKTVTFEPGPFTEEIKVELRYFPLEQGLAALSWSMVLWQEDAAYYTLVDAEFGRLLFRKNITQEQEQPATYVVYDDDSPGPLSPSNAIPGSGIQGPGIARTSFTIVSEGVFNDLGWMTDGENITTGNNVDAGLDLVAPNGIDPGGRAVGSPFRIFDFSYDPPPLGSDPPTGSDYRFGAVTNLFFWSNRYHDRLYELGFTEAARNFQTDNFGRGGLGNDFVRAEAQDFSGTNNANFATPPDGSLPRMQMYIWTGPSPRRDGDLDQEIIIHELTHGTSHRLHFNAGGLGATQSGGMGEGWSDFYARSLLSGASDDVNGVYAMGAYSTLLAQPGYTNNYYYGIRRFPYAVKTNVGPNGRPHNPMTFADIDASQIDLTDGAFPRGPFGSSSAHAVHNIGEVWCMTLWEVRARLITRLGFDVGSRRMLQLATDGMKLDPIRPTLLEGRDSILAVDCASFAGEDEADIWAGFATRGMGLGASVSASTVTPIRVVESFEAPNLLLGEVTFSDANCNNNGYADPGEILTLTVPLTNPFCALSASDVTASVVGGGSANYGTIAAGATVSREISFTVPRDTPCGTELEVTVNIESSVGAVTRTFLLRIGQPAVTAEAFDGVTEPSLPEGWTTSAEGGQSPWVTHTVASDTPPNSAFSPSPDVAGVNELVSPSFTIVTSGAQLSFQNDYNLESGFDGGVLEISIGGGEFTDILLAGGSFLEGEYNTTLDGGTGNPLGGRQAWSGDSAGFRSTTVSLPAAAMGQEIQLRWRCGTDQAVEGPGWRIDTVSITDGFACFDPFPCGGSRGGR